jgi:hypothetical protein
MGRRSAEAVKACRIRRTRGDTVRCFRALTYFPLLRAARFLAGAVPTAFFLAGVALVGGVVA